MSRDALAGFADITAPGTETDEQDENYPGSKQKRRAVAGPKDPWDAFPHTDLVHRGKPVRFYSVGVLAGLLERKPPAMRKWERLGYIPPTPFRSPARDKRGQRRLYTREQIEGLVRIAREEGLIGESNRNVGATAFPARAEALFRELT